MSAPRVYAVQLGDTDAAGVLYFGAVFRWHEEQLGSWLREGGQSLRSMFDSGRGVPVVQTSAEYPASATLDDVLRCSRSVRDIEETSFSFVTEWALHDGRVVTRVVTSHVSCRKGDDGYFVRTPIWPELRALCGSLARRTS